MLPDLFKVIKLTTGETLLATLVDINESFITFEYPIQADFVKVNTDNGMKNVLSTMSYSPFTSDRTFVVPFNQVQHINQLSHDMIKHYLKLTIGSTDLLSDAVNDTGVLH